MQTILALLSGIICGLILCQATLVAPLIFKSLNAEQARPLLRGIFPKLFKALAILGLALAVAGYVINVSWLVALVGLTTLILSIICILIIPATNQASDDKNCDKFKQLHRLSVTLTLIILVSNFCWIFFV
jgi:ABC-type transport system involved in cytochrome bd biosynthesis fused ATPase/permease subunit